MRKYLLRAITAASLVAVALAFAAPVRAEEAKKEAKAEKPKSHQFTGEITAMDGMSATVKNKDGESKMFVLNEKTKVATAENKTAEMKDLKVGEKVTVRFVEEDGKNVAQKIGPPAPPKKKPMAEEKK